MISRVMCEFMACCKCFLIVLYLPQSSNRWSYAVIIWEIASYGERNIAVSVCHHSGQCVLTSLGTLTYSILVTVACNNSNINVICSLVKLTIVCQTVILLIEAIRAL